MAHTLQNQHLRIGIRDQGAELISIYNRQTNTEHLWQADPAVWPWHAPNLFPVVGNQTNDELLIDGRTYPMKRHGFARNTPFVCTESSPEFASFELNASPETRAVYPYEFMFEITYELDGPELTITYRLKNTGTDYLFMSLGAHPAFNVPFLPGAESGEAYTDYYLEFDRDGSLETSLLGPDGLLSGEKRRISLDNRQLNLTPDLFTDDALVLLNLKSRQVTLRSRKNEQSVRLDFTVFPYLGLWAKPGAPFICIEPWLGVADTASKPRPIEGKQGIHRVRAGNSFVAHYSITVG